MVHRGLTVFGTILADPPWPQPMAGKYKSRKHGRPDKLPYKTMTVEDIAALSVPQLADHAAHLYLWTTAGFLREAFEVIDAWGFVYKTNMVWVKPQMGIGNYVRLSHEHLMIGLKGKTRTKGSSQKSWIEANRTKHSRKPEEFRAAIESMSDGPYLEMYGRQPIASWVVYGNQIEPRLFA